MSKTKKLIITGVCILIVLIAVIVGVIVTTVKRFNLSPNFYTDYNNHTTASIIEMPPSVDIVSNSGDYKDAFYSGGTAIVKDANLNNNQGVYSFVLGKMVVPIPNIQNVSNTISAINLKYEDGTLTGENIFRVSYTGLSRIEFYADDGTKINVVDYTASTNENYSYIKERVVEKKMTRKGVSISYKNKFTDKRILISKVDYVCSYSVNGKKYEIWEVTETDKGTPYINLYSLKGKERVLEQTINNTVGNDADLSLAKDIDVVFLKNGTPRILAKNETSETISGAGPYTLTSYTIFDINFKRKDTATINSANLNPKTPFRVGNSLVFQELVPSSESKCDFSIDTTSGKQYFELVTHKFNLSNGKLSKVNFKYLIYDINDSFNMETAIISCAKIDKKALTAPQNLLINDKLQTKEISYNINSITGITDKRFLVDSDNGYYIIDKKYNVISYLGKCSSIATTSESVIYTYSPSISDPTKITSICTLDGKVVAQYLSSQVTVTNDDLYYIVTEKVEKNGKQYTEKYLERLGVRNSNPIYSKADDDFAIAFNGVEYDGYIDTITNPKAEGKINIILRTRLNDQGYYIYELYNLENKLLLTLDDPNFTKATTDIECGYFVDKDHAIIMIPTNVIGRNFWILLDR